MQLAALRPGERALITKSSPSHRLCDLGFVAGNEIALLRKVPFGGPIEVLLLGTHMALRRDDARQVEVGRCAIGRH